MLIWWNGLHKALKMLRLLKVMRVQLPLSAPNFNVGIDYEVNSKTFNLENRMQVPVPIPVYINAGVIGAAF